MTDTRTILVRYDEIGLKGKNRRFFENCLLDNIKRALSGLEDISFRKPHGRIFIDTRKERAQECVNCLHFVPGIASISVGISMKPDLDKMSDLGIQWIEPHLKPGMDLAFCVRTQRSNKLFPITSPEVNHEVGSRILRVLGSRGLTVNIKEADYVLEIEIGDQETIVFDNRIPCLGGLPVGSCGSVLSLLSGGIDSPVSTFSLLRRGCRAHMIFFDNQTYLGRGGYDKVVQLAKVINRYQGGGRLFVIPFQEIQVAIRDHCTPAHRIVLYRRMMYRIAQAVAGQNRCLGLVTGESLGQVASQTLENLAAVSCVVGMSVFRPLIGMDKREIINRAKKIETYNISIKPQPDCCSVFMPPRPATRTRIPDLEKDETLFSWKELMEEAISSMEVVDLDEVD